MSILYKEFNLPDPLADNWALQSRLLTGIWPLAVFYPLSSNCIYLTVLISHFWIVCLLFFYGVLRKNHLLPIVPVIFLLLPNSLSDLSGQTFNFFPECPSCHSLFHGVINRLCNSTCLAFLTSPLNPVTATHRALSFVSTLSGLHMARFSLPFFQDL